MKASVFESYGGPEVLKLKDVPTPVPKDNEILIKVHASTVIAGDCELRGFTFPAWFWLPLRLYVGLFRPKRVKIPGQEVAGDIAAIGKNVTDFKVGDQVFASTGPTFSGHAEYKCLPANYVISRKPANISYGQAAAIPTGGLNALHFMRKGKIQAGEKMLVVGAAGNLGSFAVQLAKYFGAEVTAIDSGEKLDMLHRIGADHVIDYTQEDFTKNGKKYDLIFDGIGRSPFRGSIKSLNKGGRYLIANPRINTMIRSIWASKTTSKEAIFKFASYNAEEMDFLAKLVSDGKIQAVIDRRYDLADIAEAHKYVGAKKHQGNVVINVTDVP